MDERDTPQGAEGIVRQERDLNINARGPIARDHARRFIESDGADGAEDIQGRSCLLLTTVGRRSGERRHNILLYGRKEESYVVVASRGGDVHHPDWYLNLCAEPTVTVQVGADRFSASARTVEGADREQLWRLMTTIMPEYDDFQARAGRVIPVILLTPGPA
jgi:deazaflavin-dependent oxidoreductase (nitroreductase family)